MENLNAGMVARLRMPVPPYQEQEQIMDMIARESRRIEKAISIVLREIGFLREYRTRLVTDVVTGKLDVRDAARDLLGQADEQAESVPDENEETELIEEEQLA